MVLWLLGEMKFDPYAHIISSLFLWVISALIVQVPVIRFDVLFLKV